MDNKLISKSLHILSAIILFIWYIFVEMTSLHLLIFCSWVLLSISKTFATMRQTPLQKAEVIIKKEIKK